MKKAIIILLTALVALSVFVSCNQDNILDEEFNKYVTVTFDSNNGSGATATQTIMKKTPTALDANGFKYAEHAFVCWNTKADGAGDTYTDTQEVKLEESITLYAQWSEVYTITEETTIFVPGKAYTTSGETTTIAERIMISAADIIEEGGSASRDAIIKEERKPVIIFLEKGTTLIVEKGIEVAEGQELNIQGSGTLIATAGVGAAGIGGGPNTNAGTIVISGGTITTTGGTFAAGIGGGKEGNGGVVTIIDGDVTATGGLSGGAGIGGGNKGNGGNVSILGGTVNAFGGEPSVSIPRGIAIGAGHGGKSAGTLEIGEGLGLYGGKDEESAEFLSNPTTSYAGTLFEYMETKATEYATITFEANGGEGEMEAQVVPYNIPRKLNANEFIHETLFFDGWATSSEGDVVYADKASVNLTEDTTLYAKWIDAITLDGTYGDSGKKLTGGLRYTIADDLTLPGRLYIDGTSEVTLILPKGKTLTLEKGLQVVAGQSLVIEGEGSLVATGASLGNAGIGGRSSSKEAGAITINGGTVNATGGEYAAGIGGGFDGAKGGSHEGITITGGTVTATGGREAAGIGGGYTGNGGEVTISGGVVTAIGGKNGAGIGGGVTANGGIVTINGGTVTATGGGTQAAGIGKGNGGSSNGTLELDGVAMLVSNDNTDWSVYDGSTRTRYMKVPTPIVLTSSTTAWTSGNVYTLGDEDVIIADRVTVTGSVGLILPDGRKLTASKGITVTGSNSLTINGGTGQNAGILEATGGDRAAGIGGGYQEAGGEVTINGGKVTANGGEYAAGIGGGWYGTTGGTVTINGGTVEAIGGSNGGAGIGGGYYGVGGTVTINNGTVTATGVSGGAGIGGGYYKSGGTVTITGGSVTANGGQNAHGIGRGYDGGSDGTLTIADGLLMMVSTDNEDWSEYDGSTRTQYMKVPTPIVLTSSTTAWTSGNVYTLGDTDVTIADRVTVTGSVTLILPAGRTLTASKGITVSKNNSLTISGTGTLNAILDPYVADSNYRAAIGGDRYINTDCGVVTINGGTVTATGGSMAAGIGGAYGSISAGNGGTVTITGGTVTATGGASAAGIGGGKGAYSGGDGADVEISGGSVTATGGSNGRGIGGGYGEYELGNNKNLKIGSGVHVYKTGETTAYANGPQDNVTTRYQNMTVNTFH